MTEQGDQRFWIVLTSVAVVALLVGVGLVLFLTGGDKWEIYQRERIDGQLAEAKRLNDSDPMAAYKIYDAVLKESQQHKVTDEIFVAELANARAAQAAIYPKVQSALRAEEAEKQRQAEEKARRVAEMDRLAAEEAERAKAVKETQRIAEESRRAEEQRRKAAAAAYRNPPPAARTTLNTLKKFEAKIEVGINYHDYSSAIGDVWGEVKVFAESPEGRTMPDFSVALAKAVDDYKSGMEVWHHKIEYEILYDRFKLEVLLQSCWHRASMRIKLAEALLDPEQTEKALETAARLASEKEEDFIDSLHKLRKP